MIRSRCFTAVFLSPAAHAFRALGLRAGETAYVTPRNLRRYPPDGAAVPTATEDALVS